VDKLELLQHEVRSLSKKRSLLVLGHHAGVTQLLDMVDLPECLEMEMPKLLVPMLGLIVSMSGEAERLSHILVKHVQPVVPVVDHGEKATATVPDPEHPSINFHSRATLIELVEANDGVSEGWDVVDSSDQLVLTGLTHKHDGPDAADLNCELIAELDGVLDSVVQVGEVPDAPGHVVHGTAVEVPSLELIIVRAVTEERLCAWLIDVERG
jgi:hypothetical protein